MTKYIAMLLFALALMAGSLPAGAWAGGAPPPQPAGVCTTDVQFNPTPQTGDGILTTIVDNVKAVIEGLTRQMFEGIVNNDSFKNALAAMLTLYFAIYGLLFMFGMVEATVHDFAFRMLKVAILGILLSPTAWGMFDAYVVTFFETTTDSIILESTQVAFGGVEQIRPVSGTGIKPFVKIDEAINQALSAKMAVTLLAIFFTGPYGLVIGLLLVIALGSFVMTLMSAVWVYLMSLVLRTLLFGVAPIFLACILFQRTRYLFDGWLNQVVNACLQPIFLFIFFGFFVSLMTVSLANVLKTPVCWTESMESMRGTPFYVHFWRFTIPTTQANQSKITVPGENGQPDRYYEKFTGGYDINGPNKANVDPSVTLPVFPIEIVAVLTFLILAELASRFNSVVIMIAQDLAGAGTNLATLSNPLQDLMSAGKGNDASPTAAEAASAKPAGGGGSSATEAAKAGAAPAAGSPATGAPRPPVGK